MTARHTKLDTATLGPVTIVATDAAVTGVYFRDHIRRPAQELFGPSVSFVDDTVLGEAVGQLLEYLLGQRRTFELPLNPAGNDFQQRVWEQVSAVPFGATTTYGLIAQQVGDRSAAHVVGQAVGANPLCIFIPCHRVIGANGSLTGYAGGLKRKRALLELEEPAAVSAGRLF
ncbi:methylated-DNA--[protein]-cysteine S-methyltransferase [Nocardia sp. NEAU-G5]|uniref:Methylated-DNA--protein-cysteine methyltransferase n=1 Tax=Nocardia albiluteola TaxID=2842303 RepID=A0ABS6B4S6_9NOCA|nr:methylated-DNA--[protein]-cysteine S-methyltransferase [Nocardia albiluteola]MBU3064726.1 methylated-DNA--[protein]-cysteine S-methyltransferase [Nocardia albiluteola]